MDTLPPPTDEKKCTVDVARYIGSSSMLILTVAVLSLVVRIPRREALCAVGLTTALGPASPASCATAVGAKQQASQDAAAAAAAASFRWEEVPGPPAYPGGRARTYALITHSSGMRGLVVSDEGTTRCELAMTVPCGSLSDPPELEGLAHLAEHVTLSTDPLDLASYVDFREGDINAFTRERATSFYTAIDLNKRVSRTRSADSAEADIERTLREEVSELATRFAALFARSISGPATASAPPAVIQREVRRVDDELQDIANRPSRRLIEVATLKARSSDASAWRRLGRGSKETLGLGTDGPAELTAASIALDAFRRERYRPEAMTYAAVTSLPLAEAVSRIGEGFDRIPATASPPATATPSTDWTQGTPPLLPWSTSTLPPAARSAPSAAPSPFGDRNLASAPFPDLGRGAGGGAMGLARPGRRPTLTLAWEYVAADATAEARQKPLDIIGHALTSPHTGGLASILRSRGLTPWTVELDPVVKATAVARADTWVIWQLEITLAEGQARRWREAAALGVAAVERLAQYGVPPGLISEVQTMSDAAWQYSSRPPTALELSADLQSEPTPALAVAGPRTFVGSARDLSQAANRVAEQLAVESPIVTVYHDTMEPLGVDATQREAPILPSPLTDAAKLVPLRFSLDAALASLNVGIEQQMLQSRDMLQSREKHVDKQSS